VSGETLQTASAANGWVAEYEGYGPRTPIVHGWCPAENKYFWFAIPLTCSATGKPHTQWPDPVSNRRAMAHRRRHYKEDS